MKKSICFVVATPITAKAFLFSHIAELSKHYQVDLVVGVKDLTELSAFSDFCRVIPLKIHRKISPFKDVLTLFSLIRIFCRNKYNAVHSVTPKAGLLSLFASAVVFIPVRIHIFTGQPWATKTGISRWLLRFVDKFMTRLATHILVDSNSQRDFLRKEGVVSEGHAAVLANGSICGVDLDRFHPDLIVRNQIRSQFFISEDSIIFLFLGRLTREKGVLDLAKAFSNLKNEKCWLMVVGPDEEGMRPLISDLCDVSKHRLVFTGETDRPEKFMMAADALCLPSYREGFGSVIIEAAATGIPSIASNIYGITDAIVDHNTGLLHEPADIQQLTTAMSLFVGNDQVRRELGQNARERAMTLFSQQKVSSAWVDFYKWVLA